MAVRPIVLYPDPVLLQPTRPIQRVDESIRALVRDMVETLYAAPGIGLAANQIGVGLRLCIVDLSVGEDPDALQVLVNPKITRVEGRETAEEGCLSFPEINLEIERAASCTVEALDADGKPFVLEGDGLLGRAIQHECEHLDGKVFLQNVSALKRELVKKQIRKMIKDGEWIEMAAR